MERGRDAAPLTSEFMSFAKSVIDNPSNKNVIDLVRKFGTHYRTQTTLGGIYQYKASISQRDVAILEKLGKNVAASVELGIKKPSAAVTAGGSGSTDTSSSSGLQVSGKKVEISAIANPPFQDQKWFEGGAEPSAKWFAHVDNYSGLGVRSMQLEWIWKIFDSSNAENPIMRTTKSKSFPTARAQLDAARDAIKAAIDPANCVNNGLCAEGYDGCSLSGQFKKPGDFAYPPTCLSCYQDSSGPMCDPEHTKSCTQKMCTCDPGWDGPKCSNEVGGCKRGLGSNDQEFAPHVFCSSNGEYQLLLQNDCNLVVKGPAGIRYDWQMSQPQCGGGGGGCEASLRLGDDGNLVLWCDGRSSWSSNTARAGGGNAAYMEVGNDGNVVLYNGMENSATQDRASYWSFVERMT